MLPKIFEFSVVRVLRLGMDATACHRFRDMVSSWEPRLEEYHGDGDPRADGWGLVEPWTLSNMDGLEAHHSHVFGRKDANFDHISRDMSNVVDACNDRTVTSWSTWTVVIRCAISQRVPQNVHGYKSEMICMDSAISAISAHVNLTASYPTQSSQVGGLVAFANLQWPSLEHIQIVLGR